MTVQKDFLICGLIIGEVNIFRRGVNYYNLGDTSAFQNDLTA